MKTLMTTLATTALSAGLLTACGGRLEAGPEQPVIDNDVVIDGLPEFQTVPVDLNRFPGEANLPVAIEVEPEPASSIVGALSRSRIPRAELFNEDLALASMELPLASRACADEVCAHSAAGVTVNADGEREAWVQLKLEPGIVEFERAPTTYIAVVDLRDTMGWDRAEDTGGELARVLLRDIYGDLTADDQLAIFTHGLGSSTALPITKGGTNDADRVINSLRGGGETDGSLALQSAYALARAVDNDRVQILILTNERVSSSMLALINDGARDGIDATYFGMDTQVEGGLADLFGRAGGTAISVEDREDIQETMRSVFPLIAQPMARDIRLSVQFDDAITVDESFGISIDARGALRAGIPNAIFAPQSQIFLIALTGDSVKDGVTAQAELNFISADGSERSINYVLEHGFNGNIVFDDIGVARGASTVNFTQQARDAVALYELNRIEGQLKMAQVADRIASEALLFGDPELEHLADIAGAMLRLMRSGASTL